MNPHYHVSTSNLFMPEKGISPHQGGNSAINYPPNSILGGYSLTDNQFNIRLPIKEDMGEPKHDSAKVDLYSMADDKTGLGVMNSYPDSGDQTSPMTPVPRSASHINPYRPSANSGDAMLSAINYNENEILQDGPFDVSVAGTLPNLDDGMILPNMGPQDLFDGEGNMDEPYDMDEDFGDPTSGLVGEGNLGSVMDPDSLSIDPRIAEGGGKKKMKAKPMKTPPHGSPARNSNLLMCTTCNKTFNNTSALAKHRLTHSDERKYVCNLCHKAFKRQDHLNGHLMTHREKKPYECTVENCQKSYCDARSLRRHLENHHNQSHEQIQEAIAKVAQNAAAVIAAAAASNTASIKAAATTTQTSPGSGSASSAVSGSSVGNQSTHSDATLPAIEGGNYGSQYASESSTPVTSPTYGVPHAPQNAFQYEQQQSQAAPGGQQGGLGELAQQVQVTQQQAVHEWQLKLQQEQQQQQQEHQAVQALKELHMKLQQQQQFQQQPITSESAIFGMIESQQSHADQQAVHDLQLKIQQQQQAAQQAQIQQHQQVSLPSQLQQSQQTQMLQASQMQQQQAQELHQLQIGLHAITQGKDGMDSQGLPQSMGYQGQPWQAPTVNPGVKQETSPRSSASTEEQSPSYLGQVSPISPAPSQIPNSGRLINPMGGVLPRVYHPNGNDQKMMDESKPVVCNICDRKFKNIQALNGHMRLHGGYFKRDVKEDKKAKKINPMMVPPSAVGQKPVLPSQPFHGTMDQMGSSPNHHNTMQYTLQSPVPPDSPMTESPGLYKPAQPPQFWDQLQEQQIQQLIQDQQIQSSLEQQSTMQKLPHSHAVLQRQNSMETSEYNYDSGRPPVTQMHAQSAPHQAASTMDTQEYSRNLAAQLQQLAQQQIQQEELSQTVQQQRTMDSFSAQVPNPHINLNSLPNPMNPSNVQSTSSSLPPKFAQSNISQYGGSSQQVKSEVGEKEVALPDPLSHLASSHVTLVSTSKHQGMTVAQLLNSMETPEGLKQFDLVESGPISSSNMDTNVNIGKVSSLQAGSGAVAASNSSGYSAVEHSNSIGVGKVMDYNSALDDINSTIAAHEMMDRKKHEQVKDTPTTEVNPFPFPKVNITDTGTEKLEVKEPHKLEDVDKHREIKRRLSGSDYEKPKTFVNFTTQKFPTKDESFVRPSPSVSSLEAKQRIRSKSGDDFKFLRSQSVDHNFMRPRSRTEASLHKFKSHDGNWDSSKLSKSDGAGQFRDPNSLGTLKMKRKHRPSPLFIPTYLNNSGFQSRLRSPRILQGETRGGNTPPPYTPPPMLSPIRSGSGLFCSLSGYVPITPKSAPLTPRNSLLLSARSISSIKSSEIGGIAEEEEPQAEATVEPPPETDVLPHVNIGGQYQAEIPLFNENRSEALKADIKEELVWTPASIGNNSEEDVQYYQDFSCSAAVPGNGCNVEYALHVLHLLKGNIKEAMLKLMEGKISLHNKHTLLDYKYQETDQWSSEEIEKYQQALWKCDKDFFAISKEIGTKTTKECLHFYYLWKKVCPDEHKRLRIIRRKREHDRLYNLRSQQAAAQVQNPPSAAENHSFSKQEENDPGDSDSECSEFMEIDNQTDKDDVRSVSSSVSASPVPSYTCDYPDCFASFSSKQGLNGHIRIHGGGLSTKIAAAAAESGGSQDTRGVSQEVKGQGRPSTKPSKPTKPTPANVGEEPTEVFPCKLCGRVFAKVKSRSAHMKSHRMAENEKNKMKQNNNVDISLNSIQGSPYR